MLPPPTAEPEAAEAPEVQGVPPRLLTPEEVESVAPIFAAKGVPLPAPEHSYFLGTVDSLGNVTSFIVVQLRVHAEPMWIAPGNERIFRHLVRASEEMIATKTALGTSTEVFVFAPAGKVSRMAEVAGLRAEPWVVYSKTIEGQAEASEAVAEEPVDTFSKRAAEVIQ